MGEFLVLDFECNLPSIVYPIIVGNMGEPTIFNQTLCKPRGLLLGEVGANGLSIPVQDVHLQKEASVFEGPLILIMPVLGLHIELDQLKNETTS